jgi:hypothetical protein
MEKRKDYAIPPIDHFVCVEQEKNCDPEIINEISENRINLDKINMTY